MLEHKKKLLIFFGEYRMFDLIIPQLKDLYKVDIIFSTWNTSSTTSDSYLFNREKRPRFLPISDEHILNVIPNIKEYHIVDTKGLDVKHPSWKMYWHWKNAINNIENPHEYERVILHRCDMISDWHTILDMELENDVIYLEGVVPNSRIDSYTGVWINDYYFFGKFDIMKKFVNSFDKDDYKVPHFPIWDVIVDNNIKYKSIDIKHWLIKHTKIIEFVKYMNSNNIKILDCDVQNSKVYKIFEKKFLDIE
jgi:hypothetical protein